jgi:hypothetical protein
MLEVKQKVGRYQLGGVPLKQTPRNKLKTKIALFWFEI